MFKRIPAAQAAMAAASVQLTIDDRAVQCREGDSVAAALFADGRNACRDTVVSGAARGPFCMMGVCYDCLVTIDGRENQQGCMTEARAGMVVVRQQGARKVVQ